MEWSSLLFNSNFHVDGINNGQIIMTLALKYMLLKAGDIIALEGVKYHISNGILYHVQKAIGSKKKDC